MDTKWTKSRTTVIYDETNTSIHSPSSTPTLLYWNVLEAAEDPSKCNWL